MVNKKVLTFHDQAFFLSSSIYFDDSFAFDRILTSFMISYTIYISIKPTIKLSFSSVNASRLLEDLFMLAFKLETLLNKIKYVELDFR